MAYLEGRSGEEEAVEEIATNYKKCVDVWLEAAG